MSGGGAFSTLFRSTPKVIRLFAAVLVCTFCTLTSYSQPFFPDRAPLSLTHPLQDKNFYLFTLLEKAPAVQQILHDSPDLAALTADRAAALRKAASVDQQPGSAYIDPLLWTPAQIDRVAIALVGLYQSKANVRSFVDGPLRASGIGPASATGADLFAAVWRREANGMNAVFSTYGLGVAPLHADIDGLSYSPGDPAYREFLQELDRTAEDDGLFATPALHAAVTLLEASQRDEAARFEPMELGENAAALHHLSSIDWNHYRYSAILVPGIGPDLPGFRLSPMGVLHVRAAAAAYRENLAPFILLSGGYVHPNLTQYSEAIEMKRALIADYAIPAEAILIDPHARHTTTNLRNAARILYRDGLPLDRPALIVGDPFQNRYILSDEFTSRCEHELGYRPFQKLKPLTPETLEWEPSFIASLELAPGDPLDP